MAEAVSTYPAGKSVTAVSAPQAQPYAYALALMAAQDKYRQDMDAWSRQNWYRSLAAQPPVAAAPRPMVGAAPTRVVAAAPEAMEKPVVSFLDRQLDAARKRAEIEKLQAAEYGPPMRYVGGTFFNSPQHLEMDTDHMNAYQRQLYLPQNATFQPGGADTADDAYRRYGIPGGSMVRGSGGR